MHINSNAKKYDNYNQMWSGVNIVFIIATMKHTANTPRYSQEMSGSVFYYYKKIIVLALFMEDLKIGTN